MGLHDFCSVSAFQGMGLEAWPCSLGFQTSTYLCRWTEASWGSHVAGGAAAMGQLSLCTHFLVLAVLRTWL